MLEIAIEYERVARDLASADLEVGASEVHGIACGLLCSGRGDGLEIWLKELFKQTQEGDLLAVECMKSLTRLYQETQEMISGPGVGFSLLLPDEGLPITERAAAVRDWAQGFLYGVGLSEIDPQRALSDHTREALQDFADITRLDLDQLEEGEEQEDDLMQITEFLWVAAMMVHDDLVPDPTARS